MLRVRFGFLRLASSCAFSLQAFGSLGGCASGDRLLWSANALSSAPCRRLALYRAGVAVLRAFPQVASAACFRFRVSPHSALRFEFGDTLPLPHAADALGRAIPPFRRKRSALAFGSPKHSHAFSPCASLLVRALSRPSCRLASVSLSQPHARRVLVAKASRPRPPF